MRGERALGPGRLWKRGRSWLLDYRDETGARRQKTLSTDKRTAERIRADLIRRRDMALAGLGSEEGQSLPISEVVQLYLADLQPRVTPRHYKNVSQKLDRIVPELGVERVRELRPHHAVRFRNQVAAQGRGNRTANAYVSTLSAALRWAVENEIIGKNPLASVKRLPERPEDRRCKRRAMSDDEIERFLAASHEDDEQNEVLWDYQRVPQTPWWRGLLETGARYRELRLATWGDVDFKARTLVLRAENTKSRKQRQIPLMDGLVEDLRRLKMLHETVLGRLPTMHDPVFLSPEGRPHGQYTTNSMRVFHRLLDAAGIPKVDQRGEKLDIHALRHSANSRLARHGVPVEIRQRILGHSDPKLTAQTYTHLDTEELREAIESRIKAQPAAEQAKEAR